MLLNKALVLFALTHVLLVAPVAADEEMVLGGRRHPVPSQTQLPLFESLRVEDAWKELGDTPGCRVGVLDGGFDFYHPCLDGVLEPTFFAGGVFHLGSSRLISHGTAMASLIAAQRVDAEDQSGMVGLAPRCKLLAASMGARSLPQDGMRDFIDEKTRTASEGLIALVDAGARVISHSAHFDERTMAPYAEFQARLDKAYAYLDKHDVLLVVAAGNTGTVDKVYPGTAETVLVVGASLLSDELWEKEWKQGDQTRRVGSCTGPRLSVVAPVEKLVMANPHDEASYRFKASPYGVEPGNFSGPYVERPISATSQATAIAASLAALIRSARPDLSTKEVIAVIQESAVDLGEPGRDDRFGHGRIDFLAAIKLARER